ncbi:MAG: Glutamyl-tRNA(Gln) amidotransferase subunit A [Microgenomates bacterium OLB22]|nr:MAG: Glutamyl-tRNA(Gln) amidotransferase subunit A [Microgenomates bacterium OLB22]
MSLQTLRKQLHLKEVSSRELVTQTFEKIKENHELNAFITLCEKEALEAADHFDKNSTASSGALAGIPIALKDAFSTKDIRTTAGSLVLDEYIPPYDASVVKRLKWAGAIIVGKTNMDAWAHGSSGENSDYGPTKNPHDLARIAGGSSSGSAAAVAAGIVPMATGTDTGGSVRLPASFCGVVGLKPTYGRVSRYGIVAMGSSFDSIGHFTTTVHDSAAVLSVTAGHDFHDATSSSSVPVPDYTEWVGKSVKGLRVGLITDFLKEGIDPQIKVKVLQTAKELEKAGCIVEEVSLPHVEYAMACYYILVPAEVSSNLARYDGVRFGAGREAFADEAKRRIMTGTFTLSSGYYDAYYHKATQVRQLIKQDFENAFEACDVLLGPTSPTTAFKLGEKTADPLAMYLSDVYVCPMNLAGVPALSIPAGTVDSLPVGVQVVAPQYREELLFQVGSKIEKMT